MNFWILNSKQFGKNRNLDQFLNISVSQNIFFNKMIRTPFSEELLEPPNRKQKWIKLQKNKTAEKLITLLFDKTNIFILIKIDLGEFQYAYFSLKCAISLYFFLIFPTIKFQNYIFSAFDSFVHFFLLLTR